MGNTVVYSNREDPEDVQGLLGHELKALFEKRSLSEVTMMLPDGTVLPVMSAVERKTDSDGTYQIMLTSTLPSFVTPAVTADIPRGAKTVFEWTAEEPSSKVYGVVCTTDVDGKKWFKQMYPRQFNDPYTVLYLITSLDVALEFRKEHPTRLAFWTYKAQNVGKSSGRMGEISKILDEPRDGNLEARSTAQTPMPELVGQPGIKGEDVTNVMFVVCSTRYDGLHYARHELSKAYLEDTATTVSIVEDSTELEALYGLVRDNQRIDLVWTDTASERFAYEDWSDWNEGWSDLNVDIDAHNDRLMHSVDQIIRARLTFKPSAQGVVTTEPNILVALDDEDYREWVGEKDWVIPPFRVAGANDAVELITRTRKMPSFSANIQWTDKAETARKFKVPQAIFVDEKLREAFDPESAKKREALKILVAGDEDDYKRWVKINDPQVLPLKVTSAVGANQAVNLVKQDLRFDVSVEWTYRAAALLEGNVEEHVNIGDIFGKAWHGIEHTKEKDPMPKDNRHHFIRKPYTDRTCVTCEGSMFDTQHFQNPKEFTTHA